MGEEAVYLQIAVRREYRSEFHQCQGAGNNSKWKAGGYNNSKGGLGVGGGGSGASAVGITPALGALGINTGRTQEVIEM